MTFSLVFRKNTLFRICRTPVATGIAPRRLVVAVLVPVVLGAARAGGGVAEARRSEWSLTSFAGLGTDGGIQHLPFFQADFVRSYLLGLAVARDLWRISDTLSFEAEVQAVRHFAKQSNSEFNALLAVRWSRFPWNEHLFTSLAVAEGISYATHIPRIERERASTYSRLLNYIYYEVEIGPPRPASWSAIARIHHRSGVGGLYNNATRGSNFVALGLRYRPER